MASQAVQPFRADAKHDGAQAYTYRMAGYIKDAVYIRKMTVREFGESRAPNVETIRAMQEDHRRKREQFADQLNVACASASYIAENDNGEHWRPLGTVKPKGGRPKKVEPEKTLGVLPKTIPAPVSKYIIQAVAHAYDMTPGELVSKGRSRRLICARAVTIRLLRDQTWESGLPHFSTTQIGRMLGGRDHTTILYALEIFDAYCAKYPEMREVYGALRGRAW